MPRGRQYYDPIVQVPGRVEGAPDMSRIELYPEGAADDPNPKWRGRRINPDGSVAATAPGDFDHDRALAQAQQMWPELTVYELRGEGEDSTWEGHGPSPRLWHGAEGVTVEPLRVAPVTDDPEPGGPPPALEVVPEPVQLRALAVSAGIYAPLEDVALLLRSWANQYELEKNPSAALALHEAADALSQVVTE